MQRKLETRTHVDVITSSGRRASSVLFVAPRKGHRRESMCKDVSGLSPYPSTYKRLRERYGAKLQLHLSPRLPILHFRIVRHSFLPFFLSSPPPPLLFFRRDRRFLASRPIVTRYPSRSPDFPNEFPPTVRYSTNIHRSFPTMWRCGFEEKERGQKFTEIIAFFPFFLFKKGNLTLTNIRCVWDKNNLVEVNRKL